MCSYCLPNPRSFCKIHCSLSDSCAVLPCALVKYLVNRMAYDESTAWFHVQHCLKPLEAFLLQRKVLDHGQSQRQNLLHSKTRLHDYHVSVLF